MTHPNEDDLLLSRHIDGELTPEELATVEWRLIREPGLRERLDELKRLMAILELGLQEAVFDALDHSARLPKRVRPSRFGLRAAAAAAILVAGIATGGLWWLQRPAGPGGGPAAVQPEAEVPSRSYEVGALLARLGSSPEGARVGESFRAIMAEDSPGARRAIHDAWRELPGDVREQVVWTRARLEADPKLRANLYSLLPHPANDRETLLATARQEWEDRQIDCLYHLIANLTEIPTPEIEAFLKEMLDAGRDVDLKFFASLIPVAMRTFPNSRDIGDRVVRQLEGRNDYLRSYAALARAEAGHRDGLDVAIALLRSTDDEARLIAVTTIDRHGASADAERLTSLVDDSAAGVRKAARKALAGRNIPVPTDP